MKNRENKEIENNKSSCKYLSITLFVLTMVVIITVACNNSKKDNIESIVKKYELEQKAKEKHDSIMRVYKRKSFLSQGKLNEWNYRIEKDKMTDSRNTWASILSENSIDLDFPYNETYCRITVRYMKKWGTDVLVELTSGQIYGNEYRNENYLMVRFDDEKPIKYWFNEASDGSSDCVFIRKHSDFIARCKKARTIKIEVPIYQAGRPIFTYKLDVPLKWNGHNL